jgi:membrane protease YdiL (CAAX protease family)
MSNNREPAVSSRIAGQRVALAIILPLAAAVVAGLIVANVTGTRSLSNQGSTAVIMSAIAIISWLLGLRWYGAHGLGLRGGRPLYAGIGFAVLGWVVFLALRIFFVEISPVGPGDSARTYIYLLLFEAFATQIWTYGLLFRAVADWRGPMAAAIASGLLFGLAATLLFQESFSGSQFSIIYFIIWGILYGIIRLRTGSILGPVLVQSLQTFSTWVALPPYPKPNPSQLQNLYLSATIAYLIIIWRLWPKEEGDYRV